VTHKVLKSRLKLLTFTPEQQKRGIVDFPSAVQAYAKELLDWHDREAKIAAQAPLPPEPLLVNFETCLEFADAQRPWLQKAREYIHPVPKPKVHPDIAAAVNDDGHVDFEVIDDDPTPDQVLREKKDRLLRKVIETEQVAKNAADLPPGKRRLASILEGDIMRIDENERTPEQARHLAAQQARRAKIEAITRVAAQVMHSIEDLTAANIDAFEIPSLQLTP
jgi:hypothetical protein